MRFFATLSLASAALFVGLVSAALPVPPHPQGIAIGRAADPRQAAPAPKVVIDAFLDPLCPDSLAAFPAIKQVAAQYLPSQVTLRVNLFPLPYHRNAFISTIGAFAVAGVAGVNSNGTRLEEYLDLIYGNISEFSSNSRLLNEYQVRERFADYVEGRFGIPKDQFLTLILSGSELDIASRYAWKYATTRGISGTPQYLVNGVLDLEPEAFTNIKEWKKYLSYFSVTPLTSVLTEQD